MIPRASGALNLLSTVGGALGTPSSPSCRRLGWTGAARLGDDGVALASADTFWWDLGLCLVAVLGATRLPGRDRSRAGVKGM